MSRASLRMLDQKRKKEALRLKKEYPDLTLKVLSNMVSSAPAKVSKWLKESNDKRTENTSKNNSD